MKKVLSFLFVGVILLAGCAVQADGESYKTIEVEGGSYYEVSVPDFAKMMDAKDFVLVNVHIPHEGDIPGTDIFIPYNEIDLHLDQLPQEKNAKIVLYCRSDSMSGIAAKELVKLGYTNVWDLDGGYVDWKIAGYPFEE